MSGKLAHCLQRAIAREVPGLSREAALRRAVAALSAGLFPSYFAGFFDGAKALGTAAARRRYVEEISGAAFRPA